MEAQQFLAEFGHIVNAPNGTLRLRDLVLQLAVSGRLVEQMAEDSDVESLLVELHKRRLKVLEERSLTATRKHKNLGRPKAWFSVPKSWRWEALGHLSLWPLKDGDWIESKDQDSRGDVRIVQLADVGVGDFRNRSNRFMTSRKAVDLGCYFLERDDLLIARLPDPIGRACLFPGDTRPSVSVVDVAVCRCDPELVNPRFVMTCLNSPTVSKLVKSWAVGTTRQRVATGSLGAIPLPVPPIEEQARIVAKVDELMALCAQLEQQQQDRRKLQNALRQSSINSVEAAQNPHELQSSWQCLQANFGGIFSEPTDVDDIVAALKNLSVRGVLVEVSRSDADLASIKADCSALRSEYIAKGLMRRQKLASMAESEVTYPGHWAVAAFDEVAVVIGGVTKGRDMRGKQVVVRPYLSVANVQRGYFKLDNLKSIEIAEDELAKYLVHDGDLLVTEGGDWDKVGRTAIWKGDIDNCLHQNHVFKARVPSELLLNAWVELVFNSSVGRDYFAGASKQTTNLASINMTQLRSFPLPIPPLEEQRRILDAHTALTDLCEEWRGQLVRKRDLASLFATASLASLTGISIEQDQDTAVKAPKTQLIAPLRLGKAPSAKTEAPLARELARHNGEMPANDLWQRFGGEIDAFYAQLKHEVAQGWIQEPAQADVQVVEA